MMLRIDEYRFAFVSVDGISTLLSVLSGRVNFQVYFRKVIKTNHLHCFYIRSNIN